MSASTRLRIVRDLVFDAFTESLGYSATLPDGATHSTMEKIVLRLSKCHDELSDEINTLERWEKINAH